MPSEKPPLLIGVSARIYYPNAPILDLGGVWTRTLHYLEQSVALWLMRAGALPVMIPAFESASLVRREHLNLRHYVDALDGLVQALAMLDDRSRRIVEERWLKVNDDSSGGMTLHELAAEYGVSAERIRQIEVAAMKKMRKALEAA